MLVYLSAAVLVFFIVAFIGALDVATPIYEVYRNAFHFIVLVFLPIFLSGILLKLFSRIFRKKFYMIAVVSALYLCYGIGYVYPIEWQGMVANFWLATVILIALLFYMLPIYDPPLWQGIRRYFSKHGFPTFGERFTCGFFAIIVTYAAACSFFSNAPFKWLFPFYATIAFGAGYGVWYAGWLLKKTLQKLRWYPRSDSGWYILYLMMLLFVVLVASFVLSLLLGRMFPDYLN